MTHIAILAVPILALSGCMAGASSASSPPPGRLVWRAPSDSMKLTRQAGLVLEHFEHLAYHVHAHLDVFLDGHPVLVSACSTW